MPFVGALAGGAAAGGMVGPVAAAAVSLVFFTLLTAGFLRRWIGLPLKAIIAVAGCFAISFFSVYTLLHPSLPKNHVANFAGRTRWIIEGKILPPLDPGLVKSQITVDVRALFTRDRHRIPACGKLRVAVYGPYTRTVFVGDTVRFVSTVSRPRPPGNPFSFDYRRFLALRRIYATARLSGFSRFVVLGTGERVSWRGGVDRLRQHLNRWITAAIPAPYNALAAAFLIGYRGQVPPAIREIFIRCGAAHLIAISGLHLGIVSILLFIIIRRLLALFPRVFLYMDVHRITAILTFVFLLFYLVLTGGRVSTVRAFIMAAAFLAVLFFRRTTRLADILWLAAFVILLFQPQAVFFASFQLTFAAVAGILLGVSRGNTDETERVGGGLLGRAGLWVGVTLVVTLLAMGATFPIVTYHFHRASPLALLANLFGISYVALIMLPMGLVSLILYPFSSLLATFLLRVDGVLIKGLVDAFRFLAGFPYSRIYVYPPRWYEIVFYYGVFLFTVLAIKTKSKAARRRTWALAAGCAGLLIVSIWVPRAFRRPSVTVFSVKKGVYVAAYRGNGHATLICNGLGGSPLRDDARWILLPHLLNRRIGTIDALIVANSSPVNLRATAGILTYRHPAYLVGTRSALYGLETVCPLEDSHITRVTVPRPVSMGGIRIDYVLPNEKNALLRGGKIPPVFVTFEGLRVLIRPYGNGGRETMSQICPDLLLTASKGPGRTGEETPAVVVRYPGGYPWHAGRRTGAGDFDLHRDGAVILEKVGKSWRLKTYRTHRTLPVRRGVPAGECRTEAFSFPLPKKGFLRGQAFFLDRGEGSPRCKVLH